MTKFLYFSADYDQVELRVLAHESQDPEFLRIYRAGEDAHLATAAQMFRINQLVVTSDQRRCAKTVNFGIVYDVHGEGLFVQFDQEMPGLWTLEDCYQFIKRHGEVHPGVLEYKERVKAEGRRKGYVGDLFGRRRYVPEIHSGRKMTRAEGERYAINAPITMGAQSIIRLAMGAIWEWEVQERLLEVVRPILQVHDELLFEVREDLIGMVKEVLPGMMTGVVELRVPLKVSIKVGRRLGELEG